MKLFPKAHGIFRGFSEGGMEFHAEIVLPYDNSYHSTPMHGQFMIVQLEDENEAVLGRITSISSEGKLASGFGEDFNIRAVQEDRPIPDELRQQYLKYRVNLRVLGILRVNGKNCIFVPSHRRLPHVGSKVAFLSDEILKIVAGHDKEGSEIGFFALGEFIYGGNDTHLVPEGWMQIKNPAILPKFNVVDLVSRRTFVFARAGYGKSNLIKLLLSSLYCGDPVIEKRSGKKVPVGTIIFDPDGEYFWPDDKSRPGLCDVPGLENKVVVFTKRIAPSEFYGSFVAGGTKIDIRQLRPSSVLSIALSPEKQEQQNVRKLTALNDDSWQKLVDAIYREGNGTPIETLREIFGGSEISDVEIITARSNMTYVVKMLHDPSSQTLDMIISALRDGRICIFDMSMMRGQPALILSSIIIQRIFDLNQSQFTNKDPSTIPTIAVVEEAQSILDTKKGAAESPYVAWVKEGRKYDLGAIMITQQPGSIPKEILSQGDNWFVFHLLSANDLFSLKNANAHFSDDLLSTILNEPIKGHAVFWSSSGSNLSYPISIRVLSFENLYPKILDPDYNRTAVETYSVRLKNRYQEELAKRRKDIPEAAKVDSTNVTLKSNGEVAEEADTDAMETYLSAAINDLKNDSDFITTIKKWGMPWAGIKSRLKEKLPDIWDDEKRDNKAYHLVERSLNEIFGERSKGWDTEKKPSKQYPGKTTTWVIILKTMNDYFSDDK